jgi:hypothetical protein
MMLLKIFVRVFSLLLTISLIPSIYANTPEQQTPFDLRQVIEQVTHHPKIDGGIIKIQGRFYEAKFEKDEILLIERNGNKQLKIYLDEETGNATVADDEVRYSLRNGKLSVKGYSRGLKFRREIEEKGNKATDLKYRFRTEGNAAQLNEVSVTDQLGRKVKPEIKNHKNEIEIKLSKKQTSGLKFPLTLEGEFMIDTSKSYIPSNDEEFSPAVAFDGSNYFVVWGDYDLEAVIGSRVNQSGEVLDKSGIFIAQADGNWEEDGPAVAFGGGNYLVAWPDYRPEVIFGARVSTSGVVLDTTPIPICTTYYYGYHPSLAFDGTNFLVVWDDYDNVMGSRISTAGVVLDTLGITISSAPNDQYEPAVSFGGSNYFVAWEDSRSGTSEDIYGARVNTSGTVLDPAGILISTATGSQHCPDVTFGGNYYFVVWDDWRSGIDQDIYGARVNQAGTLLDPTGIAISTAGDAQRYPAITFNGTNYFAVWSDWRDEGDIYGARISTAGIVLDPTGIEICTTSVAEKDLPSVAFGDVNYFVVWSDFRFDVDIYGARVSSSGTILDPAGILVTMQSNNQWNPQVAFDGTNYLVVWQDGRAGFDDSDIYGARVSNDGVILDPTGIPIFTASDWQSDLQVIFDCTNYFVVWTDGSGYIDIYGARVSTAGTVLDPTGIPISTASGYKWNPQVAFDGTKYFIVWEDYRNGNSDIYGARVSTAGTVIDPTGIAISTASYDQYSPKIVFGGNNYFVIWQDYRNGVDNDIYGTRVSTTGTVLDPSGIPISTAAYDQWNPQTVFDGTNYFVLWEDGRNGIDSDIYSARVNTTGIVLDPSGIPISNATNWQNYPKVVFSGTNYFVVWEDYRSGVDKNIYGTRVSTAGIVLDPSGIPISTADYDQWNPQVVFDGTNYVVVWEDLRDGDWDSDIYGAKVTSTGTVTEFAISSLTGDQSSIALAKGSGNQVFVVWDGWTPTPYSSDRIWGKLIGVSAQPSPGWTLMKPVPTDPSGKRVKGGGSLVVCGDSLIFCLKGNNTIDFYCYTAQSPNWTQKESVPYDPSATGKKKRVKSGAALAYDGDSLIYATKGNNTFEWLSYNILQNTWQHLKPIPSLKGLKGGTGLAKVKRNGIDCIFVLKGSKSKENWLYFPDGDSFSRLPDAPYEFKKGSCATGYDDSIVYVLKDKYNLFYRVNIQTGTWTPKDTLPLVGIMGKKKKIKDGAALAFDGSNTIFAFKGGNTQEFWAYNVMTNNWAELETIPRGLSRKRVKSGGALAYLNGAVYALKGSNTVEFWMHTFAKTPVLLAGQSEITSTKIESPKFSIFPNPSKSNLSIKYDVKSENDLRIKIYNITGALIRETTIKPKNDQIKLNLKDLSQGVYILRLENDNYQTSKKLIIQK